jgi:xanthine dehydrogenase YagS FAD-binding subunit
MLNIAIDEATPFELLSPHELQEALGMTSGQAGQSVYLAGGCDLLDQLKTQWRTPRRVINLKALPGLRGIREQGNTITVGALTTLAEVEGDERLQVRLPALIRAAGRVATPQIRNMGTVGGNLLQDSRCPYYRGGWDCYRAGGKICHALLGVHTEHAIFGGSPCYTVTPSDLAPVLVALDAAVTVQKGDGVEALPASELFVAPQMDVRHMHRLYDGEVLTNVTLPVKPGQRSTFVKHTMRKTWDFAIASAAVAAVLRDDGVIHDCRVVYGGVAPTPWRNHSLEVALEGRRLDEKLISAAAQAAADGAQPLPGNAYKVALVRKLVHQALSELAA